MASRERSVSPLGTSRFELPFVVPVRHPTIRHERNISLSTWSATTGTSTSQESSTTPTTTAQHSPIDYRAAAGAKQITYQEARHENQSYMKETEHWTHEHFEDAHAELPHDQDDWYAHPDSYEPYDTEYHGDECPSRATLSSVADVRLFAANGTSIPFGALYHPDTAMNERQLFIFVRHFYCGACQAYLKAITDGISLQDYYSIPIPTSIIVIGCGSPKLIPFYKAVTGTEFPVFAEPSRRLYKKLGMVLSAKTGKETPEYMAGITKQDWLAGQVKTIKEGLTARKELKKLQMMASGFDLVHDDTRSRRDNRNVEGRTARDAGRTASVISDESSPGRDVRPSREDEAARLAALALRKRDIVRGGNMFQIGGEFLFEDGEVVWCHRMQHYRDHVEVADLRLLLDLDD